MPLMPNTFQRLVDNFNSRPKCFALKSAKHFFILLSAMIIFHNRGRQLICLPVIISLFSFVYYSGIYGNFILDDFPNLKTLGDFNGIRNLDTFLKYLTSGIAGPTGRPISLLSFLVDSTTWPTDPLPFKRTNIVLHFFTAAILFFASKNITKALDQNPNRIFYTALIAACLWLFHPFLVSTVLYVVQRMAMLATFFVILGVWSYTQGRLLLANNNKKAYFYLNFSVIVCTTLAVLSKENGALLPLLLLIIEWVIFQHPTSTTPKLNKNWLICFLIIPSIIVTAYLVVPLPGRDFHATITNRSFSLWERWLTESRILIEYLYHLLVPQMFYKGIFIEDYPLSTGLFTPISTLPAIILILALPVAAIIFRKKFPFLSVAILFFFAAHLMESMTIPLELYFEHRNYLPSLLLFLPVGRLFACSNRVAPKLAIITTLAICIFFTQQRVALWGKPTELSLFWATQNIHSQRAQRTAAIALDHNGRHLESLALLQKAQQNIPDSLALKLHWMIQKCRTSSLSENEFSVILQAIRQLEYNSRLYNLLDSVISVASAENCQGLTKKHAILMLDNLLLNPYVQKNKRIIFQIYHLKGRVYAEHNSPKQAAAEFASALNLTHNVEHGLVQTSILASNKHYQEALNHLDKIDKILAQPPEKKMKFFQNDLKADAAYLRKQISEDLSSISQ
jgi:hypothetical protein